jgi:hypothetical protein
MSVKVWAVGLPKLPLTVSGLAKVAIFTTNVDAENQCSINHKCVCGALNRHFCQTRVSGWCSYVYWFIGVHISSKNPSISLM